MAKEVFFSINCAPNWHAKECACLSGTNLSMSSCQGPLGPGMDKWLVAGGPCGSYWLWTMASVLMLRSAPLAQENHFCLIRAQFWLLRISDSFLCWLFIDWTNIKPKFMIWLIKGWYCPTIVYTLRKEPDRNIQLGHSTCLKPKRCQRSVLADDSSRCMFD